VELSAARESRPVIVSAISALRDAPAAEGQKSTDHGHERTNAISLEAGPASSSVFRSRLCRRRYHCHLMPQRPQLPRPIVRCSEASIATSAGGKRRNNLRHKTSVISRCVAEDYRITNRARGHLECSPALPGCAGTAVASDRSQLAASHLKQRQIGGPFPSRLETKVIGFLQRGQIGIEPERDIRARERADRY